MALRPGPGQRPAIRQLTGIRWFAALHVVFFHYAPAMPWLPRQIKENGYMAVGLFFILSGFVLGYNYGDRRFDKGRFWLARFARIYPAYLLAFALMGPAIATRLWHAHPMRFAATGLAAGGLMQGWLPSLATVWNGPGWSLSSEAFFYLLFPVALPWLSRFSRRGLRLACVGAWIAALVPPLVALAAGGNRAAEAVRYMPVFHLAEFVMGVAAGLIFLRAPAGWRESRWLMPVCAALAVFAAFSPPYVPGDLRGALAAPLFALLVFSLSASGGAFSRFLAWRPLYMLGDASYAVYILQSPAMAYFLLATQGMQAAGARAALGWTQFALYVGCLTAASLACFTYLETPARRWITSLYERPSRSGAAARFGPRTTLASGLQCER